MSNEQTKNVVVVGGGTAGWIAASYLAKKLGSHNKNSVNVTVIESPDIATIGVGEGTFPTIRATLQFLEISESEFLQKTDAAFKQAAKFSQWLYTPGTTDNRNYYYHLFDAPKGAPTFDLSPYWLAKNSKEKCHFDESVSAQTVFCDNNLSPKKITTKEFDGLNYAYHFDAVKFARFLREYATTKLGVKHLVGTVSEVKLDKDDYITSLISKEQGEICGDLFIDCTGFSALLIGKTYDVEFEDTSDILFVDNALTIQIPYENEDSPIATHTISTAHEAGWTWDIGLATRRGVGYVYSSKHTSHEKAEEVLRNYVGKAAEGLSTRRIPMTTGYRKKQWHKNCVAIGLSAGFLEPLESTAIVMIELAAKYLSEEFPYTKQAMPIVEKKFNEVFVFRWETIVDFVKLHYVLNKREDSDFWKDNRKAESIPTSLQERLDKWALSPPTKNDFPSIYDIFGLESNQFVLYGMEFYPDISHHNSTLLGKEKIAQKAFEQVNQQGKQALMTMEKHRELLNKVSRYSFSKI